MILYRFCQATVRTLWPLVGRLDVRGLDNVPSTGSFLLIGNHQSILDPILIQAVCPRPVHTMAKSTQFTSPLFAWLMPRILSFPVRRYETDPQAVRYALARLREGEPVGIYVEGERSWDGRLQPPRLGAIRLILKAGVPVVPVTIQGAYEVWPRWHRSIRRETIRIEFRPPLSFPKLDRRAEREAALREAAARIMAALGGEPAPGAASPSA
ncbi:MAG TPA: lysophospholipid acyltransferase family protein [Longimicrobiales bacterium]